MTVIPPQLPLILPMTVILPQMPLIPPMTAISPQLPLILPMTVIPPQLPLILPMTVISPQLSLNLPMTVIPSPTAPHPTHGRNNHPSLPTTGLWSVGDLHPELRPTMDQIVVLFFIEPEIPAVLCVCVAYPMIDPKREANPPAGLTESV